MTPTPQILSDVLKALVDPGGAQITLVLGAGSSMDEPTCLESAAVLAEQAYSRLVEEGVLLKGSLDDTDRWDLTKVANVTKDATGSQRALTERLPVTEFINAMCNDGHRIAVALMLEGAIAHVVTLNYDKSMSHALSVMGARDRIKTVWGPENRNQIQAPCLVYLHRKADSEQEEWIITAEHLQTGWKDAWEDFAALQTLLLPICIFVGLGSSVPVLTSKIRDVRNPQENVKTLQVDPIPYSKHLAKDASFTQEAEISEDQFVHNKWSDFMKHLGERVAESQVRKTTRKCVALNRHERLTNGLRDRIPKILNRRGEFGLLELGKVRAVWLNAKDDNYAPHNDGYNERRFATLLLLLDLIEHTKNCMAIIEENGVVNFYSRTSKRAHLASMQVVYGRGGDWWADIDAKVYHERQKKQMLSSTSVIGYGLEGKPSDIELPPDIADLHTSGPDTNSIISPPELQFEKGDVLYNEPDQIGRLF